MSAILSNWQAYEKMLTDYSEGSNSAYSEAMKSAHSLEGELNKLSNTIKDLYNNFYDSDFAIGLVNSATSGVKAIDGLVESLGVLPTLLIAVNSAMIFKNASKLKDLSRVGTEVNKVFSDMSTHGFSNVNDLSKLSGGIERVAFATKDMSIQDKVSMYAKKGLNEETVRSILKAQQLESAELEATMSQYKHAVATNTLTKSQKLANNTTNLFKTGISSLANSFKSLIMSFATNPFQLITTGITIATSVISNHKNNLEELKQTYIDTMSAFSEQQDSFDEQVDSYIELKKQLDDTNKSVEDSQDIKSQLLTLQESLIKSYGLEKDAIDLTNGSYDEQLKKLQDINAEKAKEIVASGKNAYRDDVEYLTKKKDYDISFSGIEISPELSDYINSIEGFSSEQIVSGGSKYAIKLDSSTIEEAQDKLVALSSTIQSEFKNVEGADSLTTEISTLLTKHFDSDEIEEAKKRVNDYVQAEIIANDKTRQLYTDSINAVEQYQNALGSGDNRNLQKAIKNLNEMKLKTKDVDKTIEGAGKVFDNVFTLASTSVEDTNIKIQQSSEETEEYAESVSTVGEELSKFTTNTDKIQKAIEAVRNGTVSFSDVAGYVSDLGINLDNINPTTLEGLEEELVRIQESKADETLQSFQTCEDFSTYDYETLEILLKNIMINATKSTEKVLTLADAFSTLQTNAKLMSSISSEIDENNIISLDTLQDIIKIYPELENEVVKYQAGLLSTTEIYDIIQKSYEDDEYNYKLLASKKLETNREFYSTTFLNNKEIVDEFNNNYDVDLSNYTSLAKSKLEIDKQLIKDLSSSWSEFYGIVYDANGYASLEGNDPTSNMTELDKHSWYSSGQGQAYLKAQEQISEYNEIMKRFDEIAVSGISTDTSWETNGDTSGKDKKDKEDTKKEIDYISNSIQNLEKNITNAEKKLDNLKSNGSDDYWTDMKNAIGDVNTAYETLLGHEEYVNKKGKTVNATGLYGSLDAYQTLYDNSKAGLSDSIIKKIESGQEFSLKSYDSKTAEKIQTAMDYYQEINNITEKIADTKQTIKDNDDELTQTELDRLSIISSTYDTEKESAKTVQEKNAVIDKQKKLLYEQYQNELKLATSEEERNKLSLEYQNNRATLVDEQRQNWLDEYSTQYDSLEAQKESAKTVKEKNALIDEQKKLLAKQLQIDLKLADTDIERTKLQTEYQNALESLNDEKRNNWLDQYSTQYDTLDAEKESATTAKEKNAIINKQKKLLAKQLEIDLKLVDTEEEKNKLQAEYANNLNRLNDEKTQNLIDEATTKRDKKQTKYDNYQSNIDSGDYSYKKQNKFIEEQKKLLKEIYTEDLRIANLEGKSKAEINAITQEYNDNISSLDSSSYDNLIEKKKNVISLTEQSITALNNELETQDNITAQDYNPIIEKTKKLKQTYQGMYNATKEQMEELVSSGEIQKYSPDWYEWKQTLNDIGLSISDVNTKLDEFADKQYQIKWDNFDNGIDKVSNLNDELSDYLGLLGDDFVDDSGKLTKDGLSALAIYGEQLESNTGLIDKYKEALEQLEKDYANGEISQSEYYEKYNTYASAMRDCASEINSVKENIISLKKDGYEAELDTYKKLIDVQKESLQADLEAYQLSKKQKSENQSLASLRSKISLLEMNTDETDRSNKAMLTQLKQQLREKEAEQEEELYETNNQAQQDALDESYDDYEETINDKIKLLETSNTEQEKVVNEFLSTVQSNYDVALGNINTTLGEYGISMSNTLTSIWDSAISKVNEYALLVSSLADTPIDTSSNTKNETLDNDTSSIDVGVVGAGAINGAKLATKKNDVKIVGIGAINGAKLAIGDAESRTILAILNNGQGTGNTDKLSKLNQYVTSNSKYGKPLSYQQMSQLATLTKLGSYSASDFKGNSDLKNKLLDKLNLAGFSNGGIVTSADLYSKVRKNRDEFLVSAKADEGFLTKEYMQTLENLSKVTPQIKDVISRVKIPTIERGITNGNDISLTFDSLVKIEGNTTENTLAQVKLYLKTDGIKDLSRALKQIL